MRNPFSPTARVLALAAAILSCLAAPQALAQVDERALDQLGPKPSTGAPPAKSSTGRTPPSPHAHPNGPHQTLPPSKSPPPKPGPVVVPAAPPPAVVLPPPIVVPTRPAPPPPPAPISADAPDTSTPLADGLRLTFGPDRADLNPATNAALRALAHTVPPAGDSSFTVTAYAAGSPDDPSTPRRVALSRALTVRTVLMAEGIPSIRIYVKALGASAPGIADGPPDRVDVTVAAPPAPSQKAAP